MPCNDFQKLFPVNGERIPTVRFATFKEEWEQRKLVEELSLLKDGTHGTHIDTENGPYLLSAKNIKNGRVNITPADRKISIEEFNKIHTNFSLQAGDVLLTIVGSIGETAVLNNADNITFQRSVAYLRPKSMNSQFLYTTISGPLFQKELKNVKAISWLALIGLLMPIGILSEVYFGLPPALVLIGAISITTSVIWLGISFFKMNLSLK